MDYISIHKEVYNALANEYEERNQAVYQVTKEAVDELVTHCASKATVLELGCGAGLAAQLLSEAGFTVSVVDLSSKMIAAAKKLAPHSTFYEGDFLQVKIDTKFDAIFAFAFIHLFPTQDAMLVLEKVHTLLNTDGVFYVGTTKEDRGTEGWEKKEDYETKPLRYRKRWTQEEFEQALLKSGFFIEKSYIYTDPFGKVWMDYLTKKI